jgi:hypothetical protein
MVDGEVQLSWYLVWLVDEVKYEGKEESKNDNEREASHYIHFFCHTMMASEGSSNGRWPKNFWSLRCQYPLELKTINDHHDHYRCITQ